MSQDTAPRARQRIVTGRDGLRGTFTDSPSQGHVTVQLSSGREVLVPAASLVEQPDGTFILLLGPADLPPSHPGDAAEHPAGKAVDELNPDRDSTVAALGHPVVLPVIREELLLDKQKKITGRVLIHISPHERQETVNLPVTAERVEIERVPVNRIADGTERIREEGDVTIVPVFEEVLVVEKRTMLKEEIRIKRRRVQTDQSQTVTLREEAVEVTRDGVAETGNVAASGTDLAQLPHPM